MYLEVFCFVALLVKLSTAVNATKIMAVQPYVKVQHGRSAVLKWKISVDDSTTDKVFCTIKFKETTGSVRFAEGTYNRETKQFEFKIPSPAQLKFNFRISREVYKEQQESKNVFSLTIDKTEYSDTNKLTCKFGQDTSDIELLVYKEVSESIPVEPVFKLQRIGDNTTIATVLCSYPEPEVSMEFNSIVKEIKGEPLKTEQKCFKYTFSGFTLDSQTQCGEELKLTYKGVDKTITKTVKLTVKLQPEPPTNVRIVVTHSDCAIIRWDGPNIGSCLEPTLSYHIIVRKSNEVIKQYHTSSNTVEICGEKVFEKSFETHVRCSIHNKNSTWTQAKLVLDAEIYDGMRTVIIACSVVFVFFVILLIAYCCYRNKCTAAKCCKCVKRSTSRKESRNLLGEGGGDKDEVVELAEIITEKQKLSNSSSAPSSSNNKKMPRKMSLDTLLNDRQKSGSSKDNNGVKTSPTKNYLEKPDELAYPNHNTRFHSLQRNIERERKKQEEEQKLQQQLQQQNSQQDEFFLPRRNTDTNLLRDPVYSVYTPQGPLYDFLSQTRTSQSTASTGHSVHDDEEYTLLPRRGTGTETPAPRDSGNQSITEHDSAGPLYDVLPRSNTQTSHYSEQSDTSLYDSVPRKRAVTHPDDDSKKTFQTKTTSPNNKNNGLVYDLVPTRFPASTAVVQSLDDQNNLQETIYDVPTKPASHDNEDTSHYTPFSSQTPEVSLHYNTPEC